jgi:hypothetical protein
VGATRWLIRHQLRQRWPALVPVALIVALGATAAFAAAGAADRTAGAYGHYLDDAAVGDVVINPSLATTDVDRMIRDLPGVRDVTSDVVMFTLVDPLEGAPRTAAEPNDTDTAGTAVQVRGSTDGRYLTMDRPALVAGRVPTGLNEVLVSEEMAADEHVELGDVLPLSFWGRVEGSDLHPDFVDDDQRTTLRFDPIGVEHVTVVGIGTLSDEVLPDELYPRARLILSPQMTARYDCLPEAPAPDAPFEQVLDTLVVEGCATSYRYYSLDVAGGDRGVSRATEAFLDRADGLNARLPTSLTDQGASYFLIATTTAQDRARIERSTQPVVAALAVLAVVAAAVTVVVAGLAVARELRRSEEALAQWRQLGLTAVERTAVVALPLLAAVGAGLVPALGAAWLLSPIGPVGSVRSITPSPGRELGGWVGLTLLAVLAATAGAVLLLSWVAAHRAGRRPARAAGRAPSRLQGLVARSRLASSRPEVGEGLRAAHSGYRGAGFVMASGGVAAAVLLVAVVFGASLGSTVSTPAAYGWMWDLGTLSSAGYGPTDVAAAAEELDGRDDVASWTALGFTNQVTIDGDPVLAVMGLDRTSRVDLPLVDGRLPSGPDEVALGSRTAADHGLGVGDGVALGGEGVGGRREVAVAGLVVLPPLGPYQSDRAAPGTGILLPEAMVPRDRLETSVAFVGIDLVDGTDVAAAAADLQDDFDRWDITSYGTFDHDGPVRPPEIVDAGRLRAVPLLAGALLVAAAVVGLSLAVAVSVRGRRRELAILRTLGFTGRQMRDSVRVQALATMVVALAAGIPVGVALGRLAWRAFADQLGVAAGPVVPLGWIAVTVAAGAGVALLAAALPARAAARVRPATVLRSE